MIKSRVEQAGELFRQGFNCSQSVFVTYSDLFGMEKETACRVASSFGAGIGRMRETCGAASGMFLIAGMLSGATIGSDQTAKKNNYEIVQKLAAEFKKENHGTYLCRELLGLEKTEKNDPRIGTTPQERTEEYYKKRPCLQTIQGAAAIVERMLLDGLVEIGEDGKEHLKPMDNYAEYILQKLK